MIVNLEAVNALAQLALLSRRADSAEHALTRGENDFARTKLLPKVRIGLMLRPVAGGIAVATGLWRVQTSSQLADGPQSCGRQLGV
jgi:hypothetical protein